jgi:acetyl esterase/lipase
VPETITFATHDGVELQGDLYRPAGPGPHPAVVALSGGAWRRGHRRDLAHWGEHLAGNGIAMFSIDYRRATTGKMFPEALADTRAGFGFLTTEAGRLGLDSSRVGLLGASAGAHLAALTALTAGAGQRPACLVGVYGVYDLFAHWQECLDHNAAPGEGLVEKFLGGSPFDDQRLYFEASPLRHVTYAGNRLPVFLAWGDRDEAVPPSQSERFFDALRQARFAVRRCLVPGAGHFWFSEPGPDLAGSPNATLAPTLLRFLRRELAVAP